MWSAELHRQSLTPAPKIAAADDQRDFDAELLNLLDLIDDVRDHGFVDAESFFSSQRFAAEFDDDTFVRYALHTEYLRIMIV